MHCAVASGVAVYVAGVAVGDDAVAKRLAGAYVVALEDLSLLLAVRLLLPHTWDLLTPSFLEVPLL